MLEKSNGKKFIVIDGQHGSGKSYIVDKLYEELILRGCSVIKTKEPTDSEIGLLARRAENVYTANILTCLFAADRLHHCQQIQKWLDGGKIVICDRYIISGLILQNMDGVSFDYTQAVNSGILMPDLSIVVYASIDVTKERLKGKNITRLARQEQLEGYDRYLQQDNELMKIFKNLYFCSNNTIEEGKKILELILGQLEI